MRRSPLMRALDCKQFNGVTHECFGLGGALSKATDIAFGVEVCLIAEDAAVPALELSKPPTAYPLSTHAYAIASHFVYGLTTDIVRRALRYAL